ncbi:M20/M25/M40 family metallo-hydrolase [Salegentibacter chungangensis]|uniref:M20/M25/M40 family metallo-hydrolase n=1 Tax=Salegentibacter chungangensis TaxID=1335724 RepID=A0ABW3NSD4_9FLAO
MRNSILKLGFSAVILCGSITVTAQNGTEEKTDQYSQNKEALVSQEEVSKSLHYLASDELSGRETGSEGIEKAAVYIENVFKESGVKPYFETYRDSFTVKGTAAYNVVGMVEGNDPELKDEFIIIGAHYDHIGNGREVEGDVIANGANDNAAGTVAVLELARKFAKTNENKRSVLFILFSAEEKGLLGSKHIAEKLKEQELDLYTMFNLEMIGVPMQDKPYQAYITGYEKSNMAGKFNEYSGAEVLGMLPKAKEYKLFFRSDNHPFYEAFQVPAQTISTFDFTNYDYYHHVSDEASGLDTAHMAGLIENIYPGLLKMSQTVEREIKLNQ